MQGIDIITPNKFSFINPIHGFRLGYASLSEEHLKKGVIALSKLL
jgi:GntR family transcriptional regulator/MocR family aminotransferase